MSRTLAETATFILAGGRGERLDPLTRGRAKPAVAFGDGRIIDYTLSNCVRSHLKHPFILTQYQPDSLHKHVRRWWRSRSQNSAPADAAPACVSIRPNEVYRGTADALLRNLSLVESSRHVVVLSADHIYQMDYRELVQFHLDTGAGATIASVMLARTSGSSFGIMEVDSKWRIRGFEEKPKQPKPLPGNSEASLASMGVYVFDTRILIDALLRDAENPSSSHDIGKNIIPDLMSRTPIFAYNFADRSGQPRYWRDVGTLDSYYEASRECFGTSGNVIARDAQIHQGADVVDSIVLPGARIDRGARIHRAIVDENVWVQAGAAIGGDSAGIHVRTLSGIIAVPSDSVISPPPARRSLALPTVSTMAR